jgi:phage-related protein
MTDESRFKPVIWIGSSQKDFGAFPDPVKDRIGYALYVAQRGGKHADAKPLKGYGGAGVVEIVRDHQGLHRASGRRFIRVARFPEEIEDGAGNAEG